MSNKISEKTILYLFSVLHYYSHKHNNNNINSQNIEPPVINDISSDKSVHSDGIYDYDEYCLKRQEEKKK